MSHEVLEDMVYSYKIPMWHNLAEPSQVEKTAIEILDNNFNGGFELILRPVTVLLNDEFNETGDFALIRSKTAKADSKELLFGYCSERYKPLQPREICQVFDLKVKKPAESAGFIFEGKEMFISWKMPSFEVVKDDELQLYGIIKSGFDTLKGTSLFTSIYRPVCANTISMAASWAEKNTDGKGRGNVWNSKHINKNLLRDLGHWASFIVEDAERQANLVQSFFAKLVQIPVKNDDEVKDILTEAYPDPEPLSEFYPKELRAEKLEAIEVAKSKQEDIRNGIFNLFSGNGIEITNDLYGLTNSVSQYLCHKMPSKRPVANSVMFGGRQKLQMQFMDVLKRKITP